MTNKNIQKLIDKYLTGLTSPEEERQLAFALQSAENQPAEWQAVSLMLGELTQGEAEYDAIMAQRSHQSASTKPSALLIALRFISSAAAIYLVGLFIWLQMQPTPKTEIAYNNKVEKQQSAPQPEYCTEGTPREILMCYLERRQAQPDTYKQLKRMSNENK